MSKEAKVRALNAWNNLVLILGTKFNLPKGFGIELNRTLLEWLQSDDPAEVQKFIDWVERTTKDLK